MQTRSQLLSEIARLEAELKFRKWDLADLDDEVREFYNNTRNGLTDINPWTNLTPVEQEVWREKLRKSKLSREELLAENEQLLKSLEEARIDSIRQAERVRDDEEWAMKMHGYVGQD